MQEIDTAFNYIPDEINNSVIYLWSKNQHILITWAVIKTKVNQQRKFQNKKIAI